MFALTVVALTLSVAGLEPAYAAPGSSLTIIPSGCPSFHGLGRSGLGVAFDGTSILYTCVFDARVHKTNLIGDDLGFVDILDASRSPVFLDAVAWDHTQGRLWGGNLDGSGSCRIWQINVTTGLAMLAFSFIDLGCDFTFFDGLTVDTVNPGMLWVSPDVSTQIHHYTKTGTEIPGDLISFSVLTGLANSGLAMGLDGKLFAGTDGAGMIFELTPTGPLSPGASVDGLFASVSGRDEDLECGPVFTKNDGSMVETILSRELFSGRIDVLEAPPHTCVSPVICPEDPEAVLTRTIDKVQHGNLPNHASWQEAYDAADNNEVIGVFTNTTENIRLNGAKTLKITQCAPARVTAADNKHPVFDITSTGKLTIVSPDSDGGTIGWRVAGNGGHSLKSIRATGANQYGVLVLSSGNGISWNSLSRNAVGMRVEVGSNSNDLRGGTVAGNTGDGVQIAGNNTSFQGATIERNGGNGVYVGGTGNTIKGNKANTNTLAGFKTAATDTDSKFGGNASNESSQSGSKENGGPEYDFDVLSKPVTNLGSNKADNVSIPTATKCLTLFSAGGRCE